MLLALLCVTALSHAGAQLTAEAEGRALLDSLFTGMRMGDSTAVGSLCILKRGC